MNLEKKSTPVVIIGEIQTWVLYRYIMFGRGICEKYQSRDEQFPELNGEENLVSRLVFFANTPPKHDISD